ncbi:hypothetical protein SVIOM74S_03968 [Streptomyces violarus]
MAEAQNIPVGSTTTGSIAVAAESTVATRMSAPPSFDVADFPVQTWGICRSRGAQALDEPLPAGVLEAEQFTFLGQGLGVRDRPRRR